MTKKEIAAQKLLTLFENSPLAWALYYFPHHFRVESPAFHVKILREAMGNKFFAVAAPRESSKSTLLSFLLSSHRIAFKKKHFIVLCSKTFGQASRALENIKKEFRENDALKADFGIVAAKDAEGDTIFRHRDGFETRVLCKGAEQIGAVRGEKFGAYRPDLIIIDDLEEDELVRNPERRKSLREVFDEALVPAGDAETKQIWAIGTILHDDSLMAKLVSPDQYKEYRKLLYRALNKNKDGQWESLWPEKWSAKQLLDLQKEKPDVFAKEYQNDPVSGALTKFRKEDFRYWKIEQMQYVLFGAEGEIVARGDLSNCKAAIACDLAWDQKRESDYSVIMPAFLTPNSDILVDDYICEKGLRPDQIEEILFSMESRLRSITGTTVFIGFEKAKLEKVMKWLLKDAMRRRNRWLCFKDLMWDADKITRIVTRLQPRYAQHVIYHKRGMGDLESQLLRVPSGAHDDCPDALAGLAQLLEYPKTPKAAAQQDDEFEWWRQQAINMRKPKVNRLAYAFGSKNKKRFSIPALVSYK